MAGLIGVVSILIVIAGYIYLDVSVINIGLYAFAFDFLAVAGVIDSKYHIIPNSLVVIGLFAFAFFCCHENHFERTRVVAIYSIFGD